MGLGDYEKNGVIVNCGIIYIYFFLLLELMYWNKIWGVLGLFMGNGRIWRSCKKDGASFPNSRMCGQFCDNRVPNGFLKVPGEGR